MIGSYIDLGNPVADHPLCPKTGWWLSLPNARGGARFQDITKSNRDGTMSSGATWAGGPPRPGDPVGIGCTGGASCSMSLPAIAAGAPFALALWHFPTTWPGAFTALFDDATRQYSIFYNTSGDRSFSGALLADASLNDMVEKSWWHALYTRATGQTEVRCYRNGILVHTSVNSNTAANAETLFFGSNPSTGGSNYNGLYGEIMLDVTRGYTADQAWSLYEQSQRGYPDMLRRFSRRVYSFGEVAAAGFDAANFPYTEPRQPTLTSWVASPY
jgi:hypothetical protein